ncbi:DNA polymerase III subunit delta' [Arcanobacterium hippocoleae]
MNENVFSELVGQETAIAEIQRAAHAARLITHPQSANAANLKNTPNLKNSATEDNTSTGVKPETETRTNTETNINAATAAAAETATEPEYKFNTETNTDANHSTAENTVSSKITAAAMSHAWLITGPPGSGRSLAARAFAAALECTSAAAPGCGQCSACKAVMAGNHPDVEIKSTQTVTISAQEVRNLVAQAYLAPSSGNWRIFIIEDADRMLSRTTNVLLKAIEEPAEHTVWILCTTAPADVLPTIRSRCRNINLTTPSPESVAKLLEIRDGANPKEALIAAQAAQSHIGVARALINDPHAKALRQRTLEALVSIHGVGDAVIAAKALTDANYMFTPVEANKTETNKTGTGIHTGAADDAANTSADISAPGKSAAPAQNTAQNPKKSKAASKESEVEAGEKARIAKMEALGLDPNGKIPAALRAQINESADEEKRRKTRAQHDMIDRELIYLTGYFRDVLMIQTGAGTALINPDFRNSIEQRAGETKAVQTLKVLAAITEARSRLAANVTPQLLLESVLIETHLYLQT